MVSFTEEITCQVTILRRRRFDIHDQFSLQITAKLKISFNPLCFGGILMSDGMLGYTSGNSYSSGLQSDGQHLGSGGVVIGRVILPVA